jgi:hypothetical protein
MVIVVAGDEVTLESPEDCTTFHVEVRGDADVAAALAAAGAGRLTDDGEHGLIEIEWLRAAAAGRVGPDWDQQLDGMLGYARSKGWIPDGGSAVLGHIER